ncbi:fimbria/pilus outer membrane usher protein, partial [Burkholderia cenocepacia]|uniref:fimbria/pilus outer membrane usher protein n=1 Tax=Burkholderia cenocepacia TaxID=95486 RepID=UPI0024B76BB6
GGQRFVGKRLHAEHPAHREQSRLRNDLPGLQRRAARGAAARVTGIARTQARVEVRQLGVLIHASQVPPGPFSLGDLPLVSGA